MTYLVKFADAEEYTIGEARRLIQEATIVAHAALLLAAITSQTSTRAEKNTVIAILKRRATKLCLDNDQQPETLLLAGLITKLALVKEQSE